MNKSLIFEWDIKKEEENIKKHNVTFMEATKAFSDSSGIKMIDIKHSKAEERYFWIGKIEDERIITVRYTLRKSIIRIIGAAEWRLFRELYNEKTRY